MGWTRRCFHLAALAVGASAAIPARAATLDWHQWLARFRQEALASGISSATFDRAFAGVGPVARVIELDRRQPERRLTFVQYLQRVVTPARIENGSRHLAEQARLLARTEQRYGVPPRFLVALWGIESSYGTVRGQYPVVAALATLAWEGRRATFFRRELLAALAILESGDIGTDAMYGSWAGAMGQPQFMPTTYLVHAVDADGDGRRDIWQSLPDTFASMANYLKAAGWRSGFTWGRPVQLPARIPPGVVGLGHRAPLSVWHRRGLRRADGGRLPQVDLAASLLLPDGEAGPAFLVYDNFRVLMRWNRSTNFALAVGHLADAVADRAV